MNIGGITPFSTIDYPNTLAATFYTQGCNFRCVYCHNFDFVEYKYPRLSDEYIENFLKNRKGMLDGIVICGGEPTIHKDLPNYCRLIKNAGYKIKLDTNGSYPGMLKFLIEMKLIDFVAMDVKAPWEKYEEIIGVKFPLERLKESIEIIKESGIAHEFRTTVHSKLHMPEDIKAIAEIIGKEERLTLQLCKPTKRFNALNVYTIPSLRCMAEEFGIKYRIA